MIDYNTLKLAVEGYPLRQSYRPGDEVTFHCSARSRSFSAEIARVGRDRDVVWRRQGIKGTEHPVPEDAYARGCGWPVSFAFTVPRDWRSGFYIATLTGDGVDGEAATSHAFFVVRSAEPGRDAAAILVLATNTYAAYNKFGGECFYTGSPRVSFERPIERGFVIKPTDPDGFDGRACNTTAEPDPDHNRLQRYLAEHKLAFWSNSSGWHNWERRFVRFAEGAGFKLDYAVNSDLEFRPEILERYRLMLSVGHDEYWSWGMRDTLDRHLAKGGNLAVFSGNTMYWQVRYEDEGRTLVSYKHKARQSDPVMGTDRQPQLTSMWSDPQVGRPENLTTGLSFCRGGYVRFGRAVPRSSGAYTVWQPGHWAFAGTDLRYGDPLGLGSHIVGYEVDGCDMVLENGIPMATGRDGTPADMTILATAPAHLISNEPGNNECILPLVFDPNAVGDLQYTATILLGGDTPVNRARLTNGHAVMGTFRHPSGGTVFNAGTADWAYGLDSDALVRQVTRNVLTQLGDTAE